MTDFIAHTNGSVMIYRDINRLAEATRTKLELISIEIEMLEAQQEAIEDLNDEWWDIDLRIDELLSEQMNVGQTFAYIEEMRTRPMTEGLE